ncbi:hypothetical protein HOO68_05775 [Candidatus Gracilibacteria bacterium]|nr:hypothetical protein [Candidatus Gracilibacteria bacterium]
MGNSYLAVVWRRIMAWKEYFIYDFTNTALPAGTANGLPNVQAFTDTTTRLDSDADFELMKRSHIATDSKIYVSYRDDAFGRFINNSPLDLRCISGTILFTTGVVDVGIHPNNFLPFILTNPMVIRAATTFTASFADFSGSANSIRHAFHGAKLRKGDAPWAEKWKATPNFDYTVSMVLPANSTGSANLSINIDSHFLVKKLTATRNGPALISIKDNATERQWMNTSIHIDNLFGNSQFPNSLPAPRFIYRGSVINVTAQDLSGAQNTIFFTFSGEKLY